MLLARVVGDHHQSHEGRGCLSGGGTNHIMGRVYSIAYLARVVGHLRHSCFLRGCLRRCLGRSLNYLRVQRSAESLFAFCSSMIRLLLDLYSAIVVMYR